MITDSVSYTSSVFYATFFNSNRLELFPYLGYFSRDLSICAKLKLLFLMKIFYVSIAWFSVFALQLHVQIIVCFRQIIKIGVLNSVPEIY